MTTVLSVLQIFSSVVLIFLIITQSKGTGLGSTWGGSEGFRSKRGLEKFLFILTIVFAFLFSLTSYLSLLIK